MRSAPALSALIVVTLSATAASADWQYTRWGMTVSEVAKASKGQVSACTDVCMKQRTSSAEPALFGTYSSGEYSFTAFLYFDVKTKKLSWVRLKLEDRTAGPRLGAALRAKYGEPIKQDRGPISNDMQWRTQTDQIYFESIGSIGDSATSVDYHPLITASNKGL